MYAYLILIPFFSVIILNLPFRTTMKKAAFWACLVLLLAQMCLVVFSAIFPGCSFFDIFKTLFKLDFTADNLSRVLLFSIALILCVTLLVQKSILGDKERIFNFVNMLLIILVGMNGIVMVRDIFSLYVFLEITAVSSFILIGFNQDLDAFEAAFKYIILSVIATALMLSSIAIILLLAGDTSFSAIASTVRLSPHRLLISLAVGIFLCACFIKAGLMPFHGWLPDVYSAAPTSVSVLLAGIATKTVGVYTLIRIVNSVFVLDRSLQHLLLALGAVSMIAGALAALGQRDLKRMLAYSSISQVGYIVLGLGAATPLGLAGAIFHVFNHAVFKSLLFVDSAAVELETGTVQMDKLSGLAKRMPVTGFTSVLASLSCAGIPPLAGFWSKLIIVIALWASGHYAYAMLAVLASLLTLAYLLTMQRKIFFGKLGQDMAEIEEAGPVLMLPALILAVITVGVGLLFPFVSILLKGNLLGG
ncbi:MAG TPA: proton-conducting transporter membrane subunit [Patescibacteria group bacterium]|nr:proton-conducting transporter membrane subunit [Patescibacteria group bacterium]